MKNQTILFLGTILRKMIINTEHKIIYLSNCKCASSTVRKHFWQVRDIELIEKVQEYGLGNPHMPYDKVLKVLDQEGVNTEAKNFGIEIIDVRIKRADLPQANSEAIYKRMQTEREREAKEFRAKGAEMAVTITSTADKEVTVLLANAKKQSEIMKGEGDGQRNRIFANAFGKDPEFFAFYRAMQAYEKALIGGDTSLILSPDSDFFKFFGDTGVIKKQ